MAFGSEARRLADDAHHTTRAELTMSCLRIGIEYCEYFASVPAPILLLVSMCIPTHRGTDVCLKLMSACVADGTSVVVVGSPVLRARIHYGSVALLMSADDSRSREQIIRC